MINITYIYLVENCFNDPNKVYIGKTKNPNNRKREHYKTYGKQITYTIIDQVNSIKKEDWTPLEQFWLEQFRQWNFKIVNPNPKGGGGSSEWSEESKKKQSQILKNRPNTWTTEEVGNKISKSLKEYYSNPKNKQKMKKPRINKWEREKLVSKATVKEIREKYSTGNYSKSDLSREYNVSWGTIKNIVDLINSYKN